MFLIVVYDINVKRVSKVCNFLRRFLNRVQNSVFEGEVSELQLKRIKKGINDIIVLDEDSVRYYYVRAESMIVIENVGLDNNAFCQIL